MTAEREERYARLVRQRDTLAGRVEAQQAEVERLEAEMRSFGAEDVAALDRLLAEAEAEYEQVGAAFDAALAAAAAVMERTE